jgi:hypothetical protein
MNGSALHPRPRAQIRWHYFRRRWLPGALQGFLFTVGLFFLVRRQRYTVGPFLVGALVGTAVLLGAIWLATEYG